MSTPSQHLATPGAISADVCLEAFSARRAYSAALLELSERQQHLIEAEDYEQLLELLAHKQQLIDDWLIRQQAWAPVWSTWRQARTGLDAATRDRCEALRLVSDELMQRLMKTEDAATEELLRRRGETQQQLAATNNGLAVAGAYHDLDRGQSARRLNLDL